MTGSECPFDTRNSVLDFAESTDSTDDFRDRDAVLDNDYSYLENEPSQIKLWLDLVI